MRVLIVDDDNNKILKIIEAIKPVTTVFSVDTEIDGVNALRSMAAIKYDLLILDINLPVKSGVAANYDGGQYVLNEIFRRSDLRPPNYIVILSQYPDLQQSVSKIWPFIHYKASSDEWVILLRELFKFVQKTKATYFDSVYVKNQSIFVEGLTDQFYIIESIRLFFPEYLDRVSVRFSSKTGASGVVRNVLVWAFSLAKGASGDYVRSVALFDGDDKGQESQKEIQSKFVSPDSAERKTFRNFILNIDYAPHLKALYREHVIIPITIEELFPSKIWAHADLRGWLEARTHLDRMIKSKANWNRFEVSTKDFIGSLQLDNDLRVYLKTVKGEKKEDFKKYIESLSETEKIDAFVNFEPLLLDILEYLFPGEMKHN